MSVDQRQDRFNGAATLGRALRELGGACGRLSVGGGYVLVVVAVLAGIAWSRRDARLQPVGAFSADAAQRRMAALCHLMDPAVVDLRCHATPPGGSGSIYVWDSVCTDSEGVDVGSATWDGRTGKLLFLGHKGRQERSGPFLSRAVAARCVERAFGLLDGGGSTAGWSISDLRGGYTGANWSAIVVCGSRTAEITVDAYTGDLLTVHGQMPEAARHRGAARVGPQQVASAAAASNQGRPRSMVAPL